MVSSVTKIYYNILAEKWTPSYHVF